MAKELKSEIYKVELSKWTELVGQGSQNAVSGLSEMVGSQVRITATDLKVVPVHQAADLVGGPENEVVTISLIMSGGATGHIMLVYPVEVAFGLVDMLLKQPAGTTQELRDMEASALSELGNITGTFFLNSVADNTGMRLIPTPPSVMVDMAGACLDTALADVMRDRDEIFAMETIFSSEDREINGTLLVLPTADFMDVMIRHKDAFSKTKW